MDDMSLPDGKTCKDCKFWISCKALIDTLNGEETACDWGPSRFKEGDQ